MLQCGPVGDFCSLSVKETKAPNVPWWHDVTAIPSGTAIPPESNSSTTIQTGNMWDYAPKGS